MPFRRFRSSPKSNIIRSTKEIVDGVFISVGAGVTTTVTLVASVNTYLGTAGTAPIGSKVFGIYLFVDIQPDSSAGNIDWYVWKGNPSLIASMPLPGSTGADANRRFILHEEKGTPVIRSVGGVPAQFKGVIAIPKGRQRMGEGDVLQILLRGSSSYTACIKSVWKWYA